MPKRLEGYLDNGRGEPLEGIPANLYRLDTGAFLAMGQTDENGYWSFEDMPTTNEYQVTLTDTAGNAVSRAPWSGEMRQLWVRDRLDVDGLPVLLDPAAGNALLWTATGLYAPPAPVTDLTNYYTKGEADTRYVNTAGDTMTGLLTLNGSLEAYGNAYFVGEVTFDDFISARGSIYAKQGAANDPAYSFSGDTNSGFYRYADGIIGWSSNLTGKAITVSPDAGNVLIWNANGFYVPDMLTAAEADALFLTPAEGNAAYATSAHNHAAAYVDVGGDTMTGALSIGTNPAAVGLLRLPNAQSVAWRNAANSADFQLVVDASNQLLFAGIPLITRTSGDARYLQLTGGSVMTGILGPTTNNTLDLGTTALRWRKLWAVDAELTTSLTVATKPLVVSPTGGNVLIWDATGLYAPAGGGGGVDLATGNATWVNVTGDTMTGGLTISTGDLILTAGRLYINQANAGLEFGASGTSNTPFFDFHSGAVATDFDARLLATGGTGSNGQGILNIIAATLAVSGAQTIVGDLTFGNAGRAIFANVVLDDKITLSTGNTIGLRSGQVSYFAQNANHKHSFFTANVERASITDAGLTLLSDMDGSVNPMLSLYKGGSWGGRINIYNSRGTVASPSLSVAGDEMGSFNWYARGNTLFGRAVVIDATVEAVNGPSNIIQSRAAFWTQNSAGALVERMRFDSEGRIIINRRNAQGSLMTLGPQLIVQRDSAGSYETISAHGHATSGDHMWTAMTSRGTGASPANLENGGVVLSHEYFAYNAGWRRAATLEVRVGGALGASWSPGEYRFRTTDTAGAIADRLTIGQNGQTNITTTASAALTLKGGVNDNVQLRFKGGTTNVDQWAIGNEVATGLVARNFDIYDLVAGANRLRIDSAGLIGIAARANGSAGAAIDVQPASVANYTFIARAHASHTNATSWVRMHNASDILVFGTNNLGWSTDTGTSHAGVAPTRTIVNRSLAVYSAAGGLYGYIRVYDTNT